MTSNYININNEFSNTQRASPKNKSTDFGISPIKTSRIESSPKSSENQLSKFRRFKRASETVYIDNKQLQPQKVTPRTSGSPSNTHTLELIDQQRFFKNNVNPKVPTAKLKPSTDNSNKVSPRKLSTRNRPKYQSATGSETYLKQNTQLKIEITEPIKMSPLTMKSATKHKTMDGYPSVPYLKFHYSISNRSKKLASGKSSFSATPGLKISSIGNSGYLEHLGKDYNQTLKNSPIANKKCWSSLSFRASTHH